MPKAGPLSGFTLIELLTALAILAILLAFAIPNLRDFIRDNRLRDAVNSLTLDFAYARSEAIKQVTPVVVCKSTDATVCNVAVGSTWTDGWIIFVDTDRDNVRDTTPAPGETILAVRERPKGDLTITPSSAFTGSIAFLPDGSTRSTSSSTGSTFGNFTVQDKRGAPSQRVICVAATGRVRIQAGSACSA